MGAAGAEVGAEVGAESTAAATDRPATTVRVAVANLHEGSVVRRPADARDSRDVDRFVARLAARPGRAPDVVLVQEVLSSAGRVAQRLDRHPAMRKQGTDYRSVTSTAFGTAGGRCQGARDERFSLVRSSAVLVNRSTVRQVVDAGEVRTWGRWKSARDRIGNRGYGCAAHPWARLRVRAPGRDAVQMRVQSTHLAPVGTAALKSRALIHVAGQAASWAAARPREAVVLGGDYNLPRCTGPVERPERVSCEQNRGHRVLQSRGLVDAVRAHRATGPTGVVGVARRIDFAYTTAPIQEAWWDRCYMAWHVVRWPCSRSRGVFDKAAAFAACQRRALRFGRPGGRCPAPAYARYYSDHPLVTLQVEPIMPSAAAAR